MLQTPFAPVENPFKTLSAAHRINTIGKYLDKTPPTDASINNDKTRGNRTAARHSPIKKRHTRSGKDLGRFGGTGTKGFTPVDLSAHLLNFCVCERRGEFRRGMPDVASELTSRSDALAGLCKQARVRAKGMHRAASGRRAGLRPRAGGPKQTHPTSYIVPQVLDIVASKATLRTVKQAKETLPYK